METNMKSIIRKTEDLIRNNRKVRYTVYAVLIVATVFASYGLGERFGHFAYMITH